MKVLKPQSKLLAACMALISVVVLLKASYYKPDFFPIGLSGLNQTGGYWGAPYGDSLSGNWKWTHAEDIAKNEQDLIRNLGVNCIGLSDAWPWYLTDFRSNAHYENTYLEKVCKPLVDAGDTDTVYIITVSIAAKPRYYKCDTSYQYHNCDRASHDCPWCFHNTNIADTHWVYIGTSQQTIGSHSFFRTPYRPLYAGWGSMLYAIYDPDKPNNSWGSHGMHKGDPDLYTFEGDSLWKAMADEAIQNVDTYFVNYPSHKNFFWGWNWLVEEPATYNGDLPGSGPAKPVPGAWGAVNFLLTKAGNAQVKGLRGAEQNRMTNYRMLVAKAGTWPLSMADINIFASVPELDVFFLYMEALCEAKYNYGVQGIFDDILYGNADSRNNDRHSGYQYTAEYMQKYGKSNLASSDQKRRWMTSVAVQWNIDSATNHVSTRRPCPPEIRCAAYLILSRGAKGIFFNQWLTYYSPYEYTLDLADPDEISIPCTNSVSVARGVGIRDKYGYPFGDSLSPYYSHHKLNNGGTSTYWHVNNRDSTYAYLAHSLIPEIKLLTSTLMQLDWVNGYSLNSTDPEWASPCPHDYVADVWGVSYMDLALFDHPYEPAGVEYFMFVNREGIADMTNRTVTVALDAGHWPQEDSLVLTDIAHKDSPKTLVRDGDRFVFTQVFEPGEGKLYRVSSVNQVPIALSNQRRTR